MLNCIACSELLISLNQYQLNDYLSLRVDENQRRHRRAFLDCVNEVANEHLLVGVIRPPPQITISERWNDYLRPLVVLKARRYGIAAENQRSGNIALFEYESADIDIETPMDA